MKFVTLSPGGLGYNETKHLAMNGHLPFSRNPSTPSVAPCPNLFHRGDGRVSTDPSSPERAAVSRPYRRRTGADRRHRHPALLSEKKPHLRGGKPARSRLLHRRRTRQGLQGGCQRKRTDRLPADEGGHVSPHGLLRPESLPRQRRNRQTHPRFRDSHSFLRATFAVHAHHRGEGAAGYGGENPRTAGKAAGTHLSGCAPPHLLHPPASGRSPRNRPGRGGGASSSRRAPGSGRHGGNHPRERQPHAQRPSPPRRVGDEPKPHRSQGCGSPQIVGGRVAKKAMTENARKRTEPTISMTPALTGRIALPPHAKALTVGKA